MAHLSELFAEASSNLEPDDDAANAKLAHEEVREELAQDGRLRELGLKTVLIGSYGRSVSIRRVRDVDVFAMLANADDELDGDEILDHVEAVLLKTHEASDVRRQDHSVTVDLDAYDLAVDVVPARPYEGHWEIPDDDAEWLETNPLKLGDLTTQQNKEFTLGNDGVYVPIVKLMRQIRRVGGIRRPSGLYIEILTYWAFESGNVDGNSRASYLDSALDGVVAQLETAIDIGSLADPTLSNKTIATKATSKQLESALESLRGASNLSSAALDDEDHCESAKKWRALLGRDSEGNWVFPLPDGCDDSAAKSHIYVPGEKRAPHGDDRFA